MRFLFVDRITDFIPGKWIRGIKHITRDEFYLTRNEGEVCFFPSLIGEALGQLTAWNVMFHCDFTHRPVAGITGKAVLNRSARLGETLLLESFIDELDEACVRYHSIARVHDEIIFTIEDVVGPLLPMKEFIEPELARCQFNEIDRNGEWPFTQYNNLTLENNTCSILPMEFDFIVESVPNQSIKAVKKISKAAPYFPDHFPRKPVLPLTILLECKLNLTKVFLKQNHFDPTYKVKEVRRIKMKDFVFPGDILTTTATLKKHDEKELILSMHSEVEHKRVCVLDICLEKQQ